MLTSSSRSILARGTWVCAAVVVALIVFASSDAQAIPAFARKYQTSCTTCHDVYPHLNAFGEAFRLHGFRFPSEDEMRRKEEPQPIGADANKGTFPDSIWPSDIPASVPLSFRNRSSFQFTPTDDRTVRNAIWEWELLTAGTLGETVSFFGHVNWETTSTPTAPASTGVKSLAWLEVDNVIPTKHPHLFNLKAGILTEEQDLPHIRSHQWLQRTKYLKDDGIVPYPTSGFDQRDSLRLLRRGPGVGLFGFTSRALYTVGYQMGTQEGDGAQSNNIYGTYAYKIGGMDYYGNKASQKVATPPHVETSLGLGVFGAVGSTDVVPKGMPRSTDHLWRAGPDAELRLGKFAVASGMIFGRNDNPYGVLSPNAIEYRSFLVKTEYFVYPWLLPTLRYERESFANVPAAFKYSNTTPERFVPNLNILIRANVRLSLEGVIYTKRRIFTNGSTNDHNAFVAFFDFAI